MGRILFLRGPSPPFPYVCVWASFFLLCVCVREREMRCDSRGRRWEEEEEERKVFVYQAPEKGRWKDLISPQKKKYEKRKKDEMEGGTSYLLTFMGRCLFGSFIISVFPFWDTSFPPQKKEETGFEIR